MVSAAARRKSEGKKVYRVCSLGRYQGVLPEVLVQVAAAKRQSKDNTSACTQQTPVHSTETLVRILYTRAAACLARCKT